MNLEAWHPILTPHFQLDWLTAPSLKAVQQLRKQMGIQETTNETIDFVSQAMQNTMHQTIITWSVMKNQQLVGWVSIKNEQNATITWHLLDAFQTAPVKAELSHHLTPFLQELKANN